jgi:hypothetical protein
MDGTYQTIKSFIMYRLSLLGIGILIGILIAPEKGAVIRKKLTDFLDELTDAGKHLAEPPSPVKMNATDETL